MMIGATQPLYDHHTANSPMPINVKRPVIRKRLSEAVEEELNQMIRQGEILEGEQLPSERDLMAMFDVGRPSIREALASLAHKGLVKIASGERAKVTRPSASTIISTLSGLSKDFLSQPDGIRYFEQLRQFFESSLVRYAAEHATDEQIQNLEAALKANEEALVDAERFARTDMFFHRVIAEVPGNPIFVAVHQAVVDWLIGARPEVARAEKLRQSAYDQHKAIFECIRDKDVEGSDRAVMAHLEHLYVTYFGKE